MQYGCLPQKIDLRDYKIKSKKACAPNYPEEFVLTGLPPVKNQKNVNSCCAHAASSVLEYYDKAQNNLSTNFFYGIQHKLFNQNGEGMYLIQACKIAKEYGDMLESDCPGNTEVPDCWPIAENSFKSAEARKRALQFRSASYYACKTDNDVKYALMNYGPVLVSVHWYDSYIVNSKGIITFNTNTNGGYHAVMVYGWNRDGWLIQNSWGTNFGNNGRFILPYEYGFAEARAMIDWEEGAEDPALVEPNTNLILEIIYKILNFILNILIKK